MISALGLDLGERRIGVSGCDRLGLLATGITTIHRRSFEADMQQLKQIIQDRDVTLLVVGLPYTMDGKIGYQARRVQKLARRIAEAVALPLEYVDERLTSYEAKQLVYQQSKRVNRESGIIDRKAAALILQQWLDQKRQDSTSHARMSHDLENNFS
ncbi:Holliday junction resolvase RuvX [Lyngbya confervoides]|uniref:Putative pre-16S rRNA nuclease n=1 Tax=Lyngbya confervoides BDU141951 TaxID=1574623 RepID=A0ABD4SXQ5_9CYAN|nr:Holliday junction resolvase RuvX [Lyngbya confervoides]MCM1981362.1 Holliday junction resolvase RuvX [Lyngbya confervoides BDU141951]